MPQATIHYCGLIPGAPADETALRARLAADLENVGFAFGGLAAGADIVAVEMLLARGAAVTLILPFPPPIYLDRSVRPAGLDWEPRFHACLAQAPVRVLQPAPIDDLDYALASRRAMGLARLHARRVAGPCWQLAIWDGAGGPGPAGTAADVAAWRHSGGRTHILASPWPRRTLPRPPFSTPLPCRAAGTVLLDGSDPPVLDFCALPPGRAAVPPQTAFAAIAHRGTIHATEAFACEIALTPDATIACNEIPETPLYAVRPIRRR
jgi:hypothetical protein